MLKGISTVLSILLKVALIALALVSGGFIDILDLDFLD